MYHFVDLKINFSFFLFPFLLPQTTRVRHYFISQLFALHSAKGTVITYNITFVCAFVSVSFLRNVLRMPPTSTKVIHCTMFRFEKKKKNTRLELQLESSAEKRFHPTRRERKKMTSACAKFYVHEFNFFFFFFACVIHFRFDHQNQIVSK